MLWWLYSCANCWAARIASCDFWVYFSRFIDTSQYRILTNTIVDFRYMKEVNKMLPFYYKWVDNK